MFRLVSTGTIEEQILNLQDSKNKLVALAEIGTGNEANASRRQQELNDLTTKLFEQSRSLKRSDSIIEEGADAAAPKRRRRRRT